MPNFGQKKKANNRPRGRGGRSGHQNNQNQYPTQPEISHDSAATAAVATNPRHPSWREEVVALNKGISINKETVKIKRDQEDPEKYLVRFTYDANDDGVIILHFCSKRGDDSSDGLTKEDLIPSITLSIQKGFGQKFIQESGTGIDLSTYKVDVQEVYMLVIQAVTYGSISSKDLVFQYTQAMFKKEEGECHIRVVHQFLRMNGVRYVLQDIYGHTEDEAGNDPGKERRLGRLVVLDNVIGRGSNGTVVFEGIFEGREVAVKRIVKEHLHVALKEMENLKLSDQHRNIVRYYGVEYDKDFVYIALERCLCSLDYLISAQQPTMEVFKGLELWKPNNRPSPVLLTLMKDAVGGVAYLHKLGIIHRDLKPQNILIVKEAFFRAKVSDLGISKQLPADKSSFTKNTTGVGTLGWQAPELLANGRQTHFSDLFGLGILLFVCITRGRHPFGDEECERDINIKKNDKKNMKLLNDFPEAYDLIYQLLHPNPKSRPSAAKVYNHPLFWDSETRLSFVQVASDRVDLEPNGSKLVNSLESLKDNYKNWKSDIKPELITKMEEYRKYNYDSVCDLLRGIRNNFNHYEQRTKFLKRVLGGHRMGVDGYFSTKFPKFFMEVYNVLKKFVVVGETLHKYYKHGEF